MKSQLIFSFFVLFSFSIAFFSCSEGTIAEDFQLEMGFDYYPLEVGKYLVYEVDSVTYDIEGGGIEILESKTFVREEIVDFNIDNAGDTIYVIERFEKKNPNDAWLIKDVWSTKIADNRVERTEENIKLIKMVFPLQEGVDFDATLFVDPNTEILVAGESIAAFKNWSAEIQSVGIQDTIGATIYPAVTNIIYADDENLIEKRFAQAKFAQGIGLVYREDWILDTQVLSNETPWEEKAEKGYILRQYLIDYN